MKRHGKEIEVLQDGHPRRMSDGKNAWRKMSKAQRGEFLAFIVEESRNAASSETYHFEARHFWVQRAK